MKKTVYFMLFISLIVIAACSSDDNVYAVQEDSKPSADSIIIGVRLSDSGSTRLEINELTNMVWSENEQLKAFGYTGGKCVSSSIFDIIKGAGTDNATFEGARQTAWQFYDFAVIGSKVIYSPDVPNIVPDHMYLKQVQRRVNDCAHIKDHLVMTSGQIKEADFVNGVILKPHCSVLKLNVRNLPDVIKDAAAYTINYYVDVENGNKVKNASLKLNGSIIAGADNFIYMAFEPGHDLTAGGNIEIEFIADGITCRAVALSDNGKNYEPGMIYTATIDYKTTGLWTWQLPV